MKTIYYHVSISLFYFVCLCIFSPLYGQQQSRINPKVEVQRDYEGHIMELSKPKLSSLIPDSISQFNIAMDYTIFDKPYHDLYSFTPLPSVHLSTPKAPRQPWVYIRLGALWPTTPEADILLQAPITGMSALLLSAQHRSFWGALPRYEQAGTTVADQMQNRADLRYALNWEKGRFEIGGGYDYNYYTYYGTSAGLLESIDPDILNSHTLMRDNMAHAYSLYKADLSLSSFKGTKEGIEWGFSFSGRQIEDRAHRWNVSHIPTLRENLLRLNGEIGIRFKPDRSIGLSIDGSFSNNLYSSEFDRGYFSFNPYFQLTQERFSATLGLLLVGALNYKTDTNTGNRFFPYPKVEASYQIIPKDLVVYADVSGAHRLNDYQTLIAENPWLSQNVELRAGHIPWMVQAGVKGKVAKHLGFHVGGQYMKTNNQYYFINTFYMADLHQDAPYPIFSYNLFSLCYATEERLTAIAELSWNSAPLALHLTGKVHSYTLCTQEPAFHKPKTELNFLARYQWRERIIGTANISYRGGVEAPILLKPSDFYFISLSAYQGPISYSYSHSTSSSTSSWASFSTSSSTSSSTKMDDYLDIGLKLEYRFASWFGLYAEARNLLNSPNQYYLMYYEPGTLIGGGMTFRF